MFRKQKDGTSLAKRETRHAHITLVEHAGTYTAHLAYFNGKTARREYSTLDDVKQFLEDMQ